MIENLCSTKNEYHTTSLPYQKTSKEMQNKNIDEFGPCEGYALKQLELIGFYMKDFKAILEGLKKMKPTQRGVNPVIEEDSEEDI